MIQPFPFSVSDPLYGCSDTIRQTSLRKQQAVSEPSLMKIRCSSENYHPWMFLGQEAKGREEVPLSKFAQKIRINVVLVIDAFC